MMEIYSKRLLQAALDDSPVKKGEVIFEKNAAGMYSADIPADGLYEIIAVGGGGGCGQMALGGAQYTIAVSASGGSGAVIHGIFRISAGTLSIIIGALGKSATISSAGTAASADGGATSVGLLCQVGGGGRGKAGWGNPVVQQGGAPGTVISYDKNALVSSSIISSGNSGTFNRWYSGNRDGSVSTTIVQSPFPSLWKRFSRQRHDQIFRRG